MGRSFGARVIREIEEFFEPEGTLHDSEPENAYVTGAEPHPSEGDPAHGIPVYPDPLPGGHDYAPKPVTEPVRLDVPPPQAYYTGGMAHGVKSPAPHNGRIAPRGHEKHALETETEQTPRIGHYKIDPIPVYITEPGAGVHPLGKASFRTVTVTPGADPVPIVERNPDRKRVLFLVESASPGGIRLKSGPDSGTGALLPPAMAKYFALETQDQIWAVTDSTATTPQVVSVIEEYKLAR